MTSVLTPSMIFHGSTAKSTSSPFSALHWLASAGVSTLAHLHHPSSPVPCASALALLPYDQRNTVADGESTESTTQLSEEFSSFHPSCIEKHCTSDKWFFLRSRSDK